ncbi:serine hydrolase domain-containing protein [Pandoraea bronchicola]|uniref:D-aminopeptidase n=1 Tax=Pandoraea bronchicola TaxID=2508287 RepID=A0A5E5BP03_9BURK|nr:serine hydrolase domain-containing protein [Pandoraea bronchicola]VVE86862.1 D-aminopeptidase [Pandoraea bronchicola]
MTQSEALSLNARLDALFSPFHSPDSPGLVVGVAYRGKLLYRRGIGMASLEHSVANTPATRMRIGSVSKHFACLAAMLLVEDGRLDIDAPARDYLPELPKRDVQPTLRQLMTHTGGERCFLDLSMLTQGMAMIPDGAPLAMQARQSEANFTAGSRMMYTNGGYQVLSEIIERVSGQPFETFLAERIFAPLEMRDTASVPNDMTIQPRVATLHVPDAAGGWQRGLFPVMRTRGEGAIVSTVDDMLRWTAHLRGEKFVGNTATWREMLTPARFTNGASSTYSLGLMHTPYRGVSLLHHAGGVIGGACQMLTVPTHALDVVIITNGALVNPIDLSKRIVDIVLDGQLKDTDASEAVLPANAAERAAWLGIFHSRETGAYYEIIERDGVLHLVHFHFAGYPMPLADSPLHPGTLMIDDGPEGPVHLRLHNDANRLDMVSCAGQETLSRLITPPPCFTDAAPGMPGVYISQDAGARAVIAREGEALTMHIQGEFGVARYRLDPRANDLFVFTPQEPRSMTFGAMRVSRHTDGRAASFLLDTWRTRRLLFARAS